MIALATHCFLDGLRAAGSLPGHVKRSLRWQGPTIDLLVLSVAAPGMHVLWHRSYNCVLRGVGLPARHC